MKRHDRATVRYQRERYKRRRRVQFARWLGEYDYGHQEPRSLEARMEEFWTPARVGRFAKWNGVCSCWMCQPRKARQDRARLKQGLWRELTCA